MQHCWSTLLSAVSSAMMRFYTGLHGPSHLLLFGYEKLKPAQREMEAGGKAWQDSTSLMPPRLRVQTPLTALCSAFSAWDGAEWQGLWLRWHQSAEKQSACQ